MTEKATFDWLDNNSWEIFFSGVEGGEPAVSGWLKSLGFCYREGKPDNVCVGAFGSIIGERNSIYRQYQCSHIDNDITSEVAPTIEAWWKEQQSPTTPLQPASLSYIDSIIVQALREEYLTLVRALFASDDINHKAIGELHQICLKLQEMGCEH